MFDFGDQSEHLCSVGPRRIDPLEALGIVPDHPRRLVGYDRLESPALRALERIHDLAGDYVNFLHPVRKLASKTRSGPRVTRRYDVAQTPFHQLLDSGVLSITMTYQLKTRSKDIDPYRLKVQLEAAQRTLAARAVRSDSYVRQP